MPSPTFPSFAITELTWREGLTGDTYVKAILEERWKFLLENKEKALWKIQCSIEYTDYYGGYDELEYYKQKWYDLELKCVKSCLRELEEKIKSDEKNFEFEFDGGLITEEESKVGVVDFRDLIRN